MLLHTFFRSVRCSLRVRLYSGGGRVLRMAGHTGVRCTGLETLSLKLFRMALFRVTVTTLETDGPRGCRLAKWKLDWTSFENLASVVNLSIEMEVNRGE